MSIHSICLAIDWNNEASCTIENGNYEDAIRVLARALKTSRLTMVNTEVDDQHVEYRTPTLDDCMFQGPSLDTEESSRPLTGAYKGFIYQRPIHILHDLTLAKESCHSAVVVSVIIMFNLALAHHLLALNSKDSRATLVKAVQLYEYAFELQRQDHQADANALFIMAVLNNLGLAYQSLGDEVGSGRFFDQLLSVAMYLVDCGEGKIISQFDGFFRNVSHRVFPASSAAAA